MVDTTHSEPVEFEDPHRTRKWTYWVIGGVVLVLLIIGLIVRREHKSTQAAKDKATQLQQAFAAAGLPVPSTEQIVNVLGEDGGAMCENPGAALNTAIRDGISTNGAAGPGIRPVFTARQLVMGEELALSVYCPEELPEFLKYVNEQKFADTIKE